MGDGGQISVDLKNSANQIERKSYARQRLRERPRR